MDGYDGERVDRAFSLVRTKTHKNTGAKQKEGTLTHNSLCIYHMPGIF